MCEMEITANKVNVKIKWDNVWEYLEYSKHAISNSNSITIITKVWENGLFDIIVILFLR